MLVVDPDMNNVSLIQNVLPLYIHNTRIVHLSDIYVADHVITKRVCKKNRFKLIMADVGKHSLGAYLLMCSIFDADLEEKPWVVGMSTDPSQKSRYMNMGMDDFIEKPITAAGMSDMVTRYTITKSTIGRSLDTVQEEKVQGEKGKCVLL